RNLSWTGDSKLVVGRVRFGGSSYTVSIELVDTQTLVVTCLWSDARLRGGYALPDGGLLFSTVDSDASEIFAVDIDLASGRLRSPPRSIIRSPQTAIYRVSASNDGRKIAYLQGPFQADVFTSSLERDQQPELQHERRLTLDESNDLPTAWRRDGKAIMFHSDRRGGWEIFAQESEQNN